MHEADLPVLNAARVLAPNYGYHEYQDAQPTSFVKEGDTVKFGNQKLEVLFVPGHAPGHVAFYDAKNKIVVAGDVLFYNSIGRTDLPGGNYDQLINSIHQKLFTLPVDVVVYPGHGPETTIDIERKTNPFCALTNAN